MQKRLAVSIARIFGGAALMAAMAIDMAPAEAATPWSCTCNGKVKRFLASTRACEINLYFKRGGKDIDGKVKLPSCSRRQFVAWNSNACRHEGCKLPPRQYLPE